MEAFSPFLVVGDFMFDQFLAGDAERLSPDAPVPVLAVRNLLATIDTAGGAGNAAVFAAAMGGTVECVGVVGDDHEGRLLRKTIENGKCSTGGLIIDSSWPTFTARNGGIGNQRQANSWCESRSVTFLLADITLFKHNSRSSEVL